MVDFPCFLIFLISFILCSPLPFLDYAQDSASCSFLQGLWRKPDTSGLYTTSLWLQRYLVLGNQLRLLFKTLWWTQVPLEGSLQLRRLPQILPFRICMARTLHSLPCISWHNTVQLLAVRGEILFTIFLFYFYMLNVFNIQEWENILKSCEFMWSCPGVLQLTFISFVN